ncbi:MAG: SRPBCC family protein, partial [Pseudomonadota bacterium]
MPTHTEDRRMPYSADQLYDLVADIGSYPQFLPWCSAARIRGTKD